MVQFRHRLMGRLNGARLPAVVATILAGLALASVLSTAQAQSPPAPSATPLPPVPVEPTIPPKAGDPKAPPPRTVAPLPVPKAATAPPPAPKVVGKPAPKVVAKPAPKTAPPSIATPTAPVAAGPTLPPGVVVNPDIPVRATAAGPVSGYRALTGTSATKTDTPIERIPQSIAVVPRSVIDDQGSRTIGEALANVSSVVPPNPILTPSFDPTLLRGFSADRWVDGMTVFYNPGDRDGAINVERIEVLKGPSGYLYGGGIGNPVGGAINIVSKMPEATAFGKAGITFGSHGHVQPFFDINQPISPFVLFRMTGEYTQAGSFIDTIDTQRYNLNPTLTFTDRATTTLTIQATLRHWKQQEYQGLPVTGTLIGDFRIPRSTFLGPSDVQPSHSHYEAITASLDHKFDSIWSIALKGRLSRSEFEENVQTIAGADGFVADRPFIGPSIWGLYNAELFQEQHETTLTGHLKAKFDWSGVRNTLLFGFDFSRYHDQGFIDAAFVGFVDLTNPTFPTPYTDPGPRKKDQIVDTTTTGAFVQLQTSIWERLHLTAGLRSASIESTFRNTTAGTTATTDVDKLLPRIGAVVDIVKGFTLFAGYSEGMRAQPFLNFAGEPRPERSEQLEGGMKFNLSGTLTGTLSIFEIYRHNVATTDPATFLSLANGEQRSRGVDADVIWQPTRAFKVLASYGYTEAVYAREVSGTLFSPAILAGTRVPGVPEHSGRVWLHYAFQQDWLKGFSAGIGVTAATDKLISTQNPFTSDAYYTVDARIAYEARHYEAALTLRNLTDQHYYDRYGYFGGRVIPSDGLTAYGTFALKY